MASVIITHTVIEHLEPSSSMFVNENHQSVVIISILTTNQNQQTNLTSLNTSTNMQTSQLEHHKPAAKIPVATFGR